MKSLKRPVPVFVLLTILMHGLWACTGMGIPNSTPTPTALAVLPLDQPGVVNTDTVPVRMGPGAAFELAVLINLGYSIELVGQSEDGTWYKVEIPGYTGDQSSLWIASDFVDIVSSTDTPTATPLVLGASPTLTETGTGEGSGSSPGVTTESATSPAVTLTIITEPSASSCNVPAGWTGYVVQPGDTLFRLATKTNTTVEELMQANCLASNQINAGTRLYLPFVPPIDTQIPVDTPVPTPSGTQILVDTPLPTTTAATATLTPTNTLILVDTPTKTSTFSVTHQGPLGTPGTPVP
jgi:LysM repeat protein